MTITLLIHLILFFEMIKSVLYYCIVLSCGVIWKNKTICSHQQTTNTISWFLLQIHLTGRNRFSETPIIKSNFLMFTDLYPYRQVRTTRTWDEAKTHCSYFNMTFVGDFGWRWTAPADGIYSTGRDEVAAKVSLEVSPVPRQGFTWTTMLYF